MLKRVVCNPSFATKQGRFTPKSTYLSTFLCQHCLIKSRDPGFMKHGWEQEQVFAWVLCLPAQAMSQNRGKAPKMCVNKVLYDPDCVYKAGNIHSELYVPRSASVLVSTAQL